MMVCLIGQFLLMGMGGRSVGLGGDGFVRLVMRENGD
jgi:hypothetical protein